MSFSSDVKKELAGLPIPEMHCARAELAAAITYAHHAIVEDGGRYSFELHTEYAFVADRIQRLMEVICRVQPIIIGQEQKEKQNGNYIVQIKNSEDTVRILKAVRLLNDRGELDEDEHLYGNPLLTLQECRRAYLRGAFFTAGSISDPSKNYHFEYVCQTGAKAEQLQFVLESFQLDAKTVLRKKYHVVYLKEGSMISDLLNIMEAHIALMKFENIRIYKDVRNTVNRRVNCETANLNKTVSAARRQIEDIEYIQNTVGLDKLPDNLREIAYIRLEEPDVALKELGEMLEPPVGKSGVNHRLRKLGQAAQKIREQGHL